MSSKYGEIPSHEQVAREANLPSKVNVEDLIGEPIVMMEWEPGTARLPQTGETTKGFWAVAIREVDDERITFFVGQTVLIKELNALKPPFRTTIVRDGTAYEFR